MATDGGPNIEKDGLVFGMDTGYGVANNSTTTRFYRGGPTENRITNVGVSTTGWSQYGWSGGFVVTPDHDNTFELTSTNGWHNATFDHGVSTGTINVSFEYKLKSKQTTGIWGFVLNGTHLGSYTNWISSLNSTNLPSLTEWKTFSGTYSGNGDTKLAIGLRGNDTQGLTDTMYVKNLQVENKDHQTPFVNGTRSSTQSLIDLTKTTDIDVSNVSFDSTGQPTFDGTDDSIVLADPGVSSSTGFSIELVIKPGNASSNPMVITPLSGGIDHFIRFNGSSQLYIRMVVAADSSVQDFKTNTSLSSTDYHYVTFTFKQSEGGKAYYNGTLENSSTANFTALDWTSTWRVGQRGNNTNFYQGELPVLRVYDRVLSADEIQQNYNAYKNRFDI